MSAPFPFPWTQEDGLAAVLEDPLLWATALSYGHPAVRTQDLRKGIKRFLKKVRPGRIDIASDDSFGRAIVAMLRAAQQRRRFAHETAGLPVGFSALLGRHLLVWLEQERSRQELLARLNVAPEDLAAALPATPSDGELWTITLFVAAKAMLDPARGPAYAEALLAWDNRFAQHVLAAPPADEPNAVADEAPSGEADDDGGGGHEPVFSVSSSPGLPDAADDESRGAVGALQRLLPRYDAWTSEFSLAELERALELLEQVAEGPRTALRELDAAQARLQGQIEDLPVLPVLQPLRELITSEVARSASLVGAREALEHRAAAVASAARAVDRIEQLCQRLAIAPEWPDPPPGAQPGPGDERIAAVLAWLDEYGDRLRSDLMRVETEESTADELLTGWAALAPGTPEDPDIGSEGAVLVSGLRLLFAGKLRTARREHLGPVAADRGLLAALLAFLALRARPAACALLAELARGAAVEAVFALLAVIDDATLHALAGDPALPVELCEGLFLLALVRARADLLETLTPQVRGDPAFCELVQVARQQARAAELADVARRIFHAIDELVHGPPADPAETGRALQSRLLDQINLPPGMKKLHRELRIHAQRQLLQPLRGDVEAGRAADALRKWCEQGSPDERLSRCVEQLDAGALRNLTEVHEDNTRKFLAGFEQNLRAWAVACAPHSGGDPLQRAVARLVEAARPRSAAVVRALRELGRDAPSQPLFLADSQVLNEPGARVEPVHVHSFVLAIARKPVPAVVYLADRLRQVFGDGPAGLVDAVEALLRRQEYGAARAAAGDDSGLLARVDEAVGRRRAAVLAEHEALLDDARGAAADNLEISGYVELFDAALADEQFADVETVTYELVPLIRRHRLLQDPARRQALEFLREAGELPETEAPIERLEERVAKIRERHEAERVHLQFVRDLCDDAGLGEFARPHLGPLLARLDRPQCWPAVALAERLAHSLDRITVYLRTLVESRGDQPETIGQLLEAMPRYVAERLQQMVSDPSTDPLAELLNLLDRYALPPRVLQLVAPATLPPPAHGRPTASRVRQAVAVAHEASDRLAGDIRRRIAQLAEQVAESGAKPTGGVEDAVKQKDWPAVMRHAAWMIRFVESSQITRSDLRLPIYEGLFAFARARALLADQHAIRDVGFIYDVVAAFWSGSDLLQFLAPRELDALLVDALAGRDGARSDDPGARITELMRGLVAAQSDEPVHAWASELMWAASQIHVRDAAVSARIADTLWELLKNQSSARPRVDLLHWLHRLRREEALRHLAQRAPNQNFVVQCLHAFERAERDPDGRPQALQLSAAFREQAGSRKNTQPWILLFLRLAQSSVAADPDAPPVIVSAPDSVVQDDGDGSYALELFVEPRLSADPPEALDLQLDEHLTVPLISDDEDLLTPRTITVRLQLAPHTRGGDLIAVPYVLTGRTFGGRSLASRGQLDLELAGATANPLRSDEVLRAWPGATGDPVYRKQGFFGREREIGEIQRALCDDVRPRSLMIFGQRRVGKTSLLLEMVRLFPPDPGRVTGVFLDVSNLDLPRGQSMSKRLFDAITGACVDSVRNEMVRDALGPQPDRRLKKLVHGLDPTVSLFNALHAFKDSLHEATNGLVGRLALFVDEFDRFVEPLMQGGEVEREVERLMWDLRQIVQQSRDVSLVLAGSGLQKMMTREYSRPLYGSIAQVEIAPFSWESDRSAILDTFLPEPIRGRLCRPELIDKVARDAAALCGGHPYFLALVGQAAGLCAKGRSVNRPLVNLAARKLIAGNLPELDRRLDEHLFYSHIFETLKRVPLREQSLARIVLVHLASRTTEALPRLGVDDALEVPDLLRATSEAERARALQLLVDEGAVIRDEGQVRIAVPLTALALRGSAQRLRREALQHVTERPSPT